MSRRGETGESSNFEGALEAQRSTNGSPVRRWLCRHFVEDVEQLVVGYLFFVLTKSPQYIKCDV